MRHIFRRNEPWLALAIGALFCVVAAVSHAQLPWQPGVWTPASSAPSYTGSGDAVSGASFYGGVFAYSAATRGNKALNVCNVADVACADVASDATTGIVPNTPVIGGVTCGTTPGVNLCTVKTIYDQTATVGDATQATIASRATFVPSCSGSIPCLGDPSGTACYAAGTFSQASYTFSDAATTHTGAGGNVRSVASASNSLLGLNASTQPIMFASAFATSSVTLTLDTFYALIGTDNSSTGALTINVNGTQNTGTGGTTAASGATALMDIVGCGSASNGDHLEFRMDPVAMSNGNITTLTANMRSRGGY